MDTANYTTWLEIDLGAVRNNVRQTNQITGRPVMAVVKGNAYGHGVEAVSRAALEAGATWLAVARFEEAQALRDMGFTAPILVLGYTPPGRAAEAAARRIALAVTEPETASAYASATAGGSKPLRVHLKLDTGMGRLGVTSGEAVPFIQHVRGLAGLEVEGVFTHFACADQPARDETPAQLCRFQEVVASLQTSGWRPPLLHTSNSAASIYFPDAWFDLVRLGIALYGLDPSHDAPTPPEFQKVLSWKTRLVSVKTLPAGHGVSYGHRYHTSADERIGVIAVGYADGLRRKLDVNHALVRGVRVPVVGTVCMDQCMLQLDSVPDARVGDEVVLIGNQGSARITAEDVADAWGTINYEVTCGMAARVPRFYIG